MPLPGYEVQVLWIDLGPLIPLARELKPWLSSQELEHAARFKLERDRDGFIASHSVLRYVLGEQLQCAPHAISFQLLPDGKPELAGDENSSQPRFNLSHTTGYMALGLSVGRRVGVDIERVGELPDLPQLMTSVLSKDEARAIDSLPPASRLDSFYKLWTGKEALLKATGAGISSGRLLHISLLPIEHTAWEVTLETGNAGHPGWTVEHRSPVPEMAGAIAYEGKRALISEQLLDGEAAAALGRSMTSRAKG